MLISREELRYDFGGATFNMDNPDDRALLGWIFDQFLYGEVTGIQCGHWLYHAPHLSAASFLARQATEELSHVRRILRILSILGQKPGPAHPAVRFLSTGMMGGSWGEHVMLEMALGEGLVLGVFYALAETVSDPEIKKILETASAEEEKHVEFGERETINWLKSHPGDRPLLLGQALLQIKGMQWMKRFVLKRLAVGPRASHPVLRQFSEFYDHSLKQFEVRVARLGLSAIPIAQIGHFQKIVLFGLLPLRKLRSRIFGRFNGQRRLLTDTYLNDPWLSAEHERQRL